MNKPLLPIEQIPPSADAPLKKYWNNDFIKESLLYYKQTKDEDYFKDYIYPFFRCLFRYAWLKNSLSYVNDEQIKQDIEQWFMIDLLSKGIVLYDFKRSPHSYFCSYAQTTIYNHIRKIILSENRELKILNTPEGIDFLEKINIEEPESNNDYEQNIRNEIAYFLYCRLIDCDKKSNQRLRVKRWFIDYIQGNVDYPKSSNTNLLLSRGENYRFLCKSLKVSKTIISQIRNEIIDEINLYHQLKKNKTLNLPPSSSLANSSYDKMIIYLQHLIYCKSYQKRQLLDIFKNILAYFTTNQTIHFSTKTLTDLHNRTGYSRPRILYCLNLIKRKYKTFKSLY